MGTRAALVAVVVMLGIAAIGCSTETEQLPELPKGPDPAPAAPVADTRPNSVPLGESTRQTQSAIGGAYRSSLARIDNYAITHQLNIYRGEHGHFPKSNEEFHEKFMKGYGIPYPEMEEGYELVYDPEDQAIYQKLIEEPAAEPAGETAEGVETPGEESAGTGAATGPSDEAASSGADN
jgi:hypothetical protein